MTETPEYRCTPEQLAMIERAEKVWTKYKDLWDFPNLNHRQVNGIRNLLFRMQEAEHQHFGIEIPKGELESE